MTAAAPGHPRIHLLAHPSKVLGRRRKRCFIVRPPQEAGPGPFPVCYFLHGWGGDAGSYLRHPGLRDRILAAPHWSVFPESFRRWFINDHEGHRYEDYFVHELCPFVEERFEEQIDPARRSIVGFSMGGASAFLLAVRYRGFFRAVACHAGAFGAPRREGDPYARTGEERPWLMPTEAQHNAVWGPPGSPTRRSYDPYRYVGLAKDTRIYLDVGLGDYPRMIEMNRSFHRALLEAGVPHVYAERPGGHDMDFVASALPHSLAMVGARASAAPSSKTSALPDRLRLTSERKPAGIPRRLG